jgi:LPXTG-motif cell wall-anchored protein
VGGVGIAEIVGAATPVCTPLTPLPVKPWAESELACAEQFAPAVALPSTDGASGTPVWVWVALGVGVVVIAGGAVVLLRRRHAGANPSSD